MVYVMDYRRFRFGRIEHVRAWALLEAGGGRYWEGRYRDEAALVDKLQEALINITKTAPFGKPQEIARAALGENKDGA